MRFCSMCFLCKDETDFYKYSSSKTGLNTRCKNCIDYINCKKRPLCVIKLKGYQNGVFIDNSIDYRKQYYSKNREKICKKVAKYNSKKSKSDPIFRFKNTIRVRIRIFLKSKGFDKETSTQKILGAPLDFVKTHIENQFSNKMTWDNHGEWHIDHIIPLSTAKTRNDILLLCHYSNLQPLWKEDNLKKSNKLNSSQLLLLV